MTVLDDVLGSLQQMTLVQLLFAFLTCTFYAALQSSLFASGLRSCAAVAAALAATCFVLSTRDWVHAVMLLAFAVTAWGAMIAVVWLLGQLLGFSGDVVPRVLDSAFSQTLPDDTVSALTGPTNRPVAGTPLTTAQMAAQMAAQSR